MNLAKYIDFGFLFVSPFFPLEDKNSSNDPEMWIECSVAVAIVCMYIYLETEVRTKLLSS